MKTEIKASDESESPAQYAGPKVMHPAYVAAREATGGLAELQVMSKAGDPEAMRILHSIACTMIKNLNDRHLDYADSVLEWPVVLPQDRTARNAVTERANAMRIGSVKAGGKGAGENLCYDSNKGFAMTNLKRLDEIRGLLKMTGYDGQEHELMDDNGFSTGWTADDEFMSITFGEYDPSLMLEIRDLPEYSPTTRSKWIIVMVNYLIAHEDLIPEAIKGRNKTYCPATLKSPKPKNKSRGGTVKKALIEGLEQVVAVPEKFGH